ncbi:MAG: SMC-Scp complex subunit ScpB [Anaerolineae bacterium]
MDLACFVEALLFVADGPAELQDLASALSVSVKEIEQAIGELQAAESERGLRVQMAGSSVQMVTMPEAADAVETFLGIGMGGKLSSAALETLAIIAYRQPITRARINAIRGVDSDGVIRTLVAKGLVEKVGTLDQVGRPLLYGTTFEFLEYFGIRSLDALPTLPELEDYAGMAEDDPES